MKMTFAVIREIIYLVSIVGGIAFYIAGQAKDKEYIQKDITQIKTDQKEILKALEDINNKFLSQAELNGRFSSYMVLDSAKP